MRSLVLPCLIVLLLIASAPAQIPAPPQTTRFHIPSQPLDEALKKLGEQAGITLLFADDTHAEALTSQALDGVFTAEEALRRLLAATGLHAEHLSGSSSFMVSVQPVLPVVKKKLRSPRPVARSSLSSPELDQVVVTGTHIRGAPAESSPVIAYSREDIESTGATTVDQFARLMPENFGLINAQTSTGAATNPVVGYNLVRGTALDLRGLGPGATLVLLNGQRVAPAGQDGSYVDISLIPLVALDRVEVLTDGASAIYGSDAVAGVVNFIMRPDFNGLETTVYYGEATRTGGHELGAALRMGSVWQGGGAMFAAETFQQPTAATSSGSQLVSVSAPYQVVPSQSRQSGVLTLHQDVGPRVKLSAQELYSERDFSQDYVSDPPILVQSRGGAKLLASSFTADLELAGHWQTEITGSFTQEQETGVTSVSTAQQLFETRSAVQSVDWRAGGPVFSIAGAPLQLSLGASLRGERFNDLIARLGPNGSGLAREVLGVYAEALVPIIEAGNAFQGVHRLELSLALRRDAYHNSDSEAANVAARNPKVGLLWSPRTDLILRGTYATSFRVAPLAQTSESHATALLLPFLNPAAPGSPINTLYLTGNHNTLQPERARSLTAGFDFRPNALPDSVLSATWFHVNYMDRIATPPVAGPVTSAFSQLATLAPYINLAPSAADIQAVYAHYTVLEPVPLPQPGVQAIFDSRLQNMASIAVSGVEAMLDATFVTGLGDWSFHVQGQYLLQLESQAAPTTAYVPLANTVFNPPRVRVRAGTGWSYQGFTVTLTGDYTSSTQDTLVVSAPRVASWLIWDSQVSYNTGARFASTLFKDTTVTLSLNNLTNRAPPFVAGQPGQSLNFDAANASPLGRVIALRVSKHW